MNSGSKQSQSKDKGNKRKATRVQRACSNCRKRKQGCEEERPCRRCVEKGIECVEVEPKRKRGRAKTYTQRTQGAGRERRNSNEEMPDYDEEDDVEDSFSYESEGEGEEDMDSFSSEEDQSSMISPRGNSTNSSTASNSARNSVSAANSASSTLNSSSGSVVIPHVFKLNAPSSNTSSGSNLHTAFSNSQSHGHSHSHSHSHNHSLSNSSNHVHTHSHHSNSHSHQKRDSTARKRRSVSPTGTSPPDSPSHGDVNDEVDSEHQHDHENDDHNNVGIEILMEEENMMDDYDSLVPNYFKPERGINLALLLPFIGNMCNNIDDQNLLPMFVDEDYGYLLECESNFQSTNENLSHHQSTNNSNHSLSNSSDSVTTSNTDSMNNNYNHNQYNPYAAGFGNSGLKSQLQGNNLDIHQKILSSNLPFQTNSFSATKNNGHGPSFYVEEGDSKSQIYLKECWEEFMYKSSLKSYDADLQRVSESWKEIIRCLRNLEWQKAQLLMQEMEILNGKNDYVGEMIQPSIVFWSSGGRIHHANESFCKLVGYSLDELRAEVSADLNSGNSTNPYYQHHHQNNYNNLLWNGGNNKMRAHSFFHPEEMMKILKRQLEAVQNPERSSYQMNTRLLSKYRQEIPVSTSVLNLRDNLGVSLLTIAIFV